MPGFLVRIIEEIAYISIPPNDPLQQFMQDHKNDMHMQERNEVDDIFLRQPCWESALEANKICFIEHIPLVHNTFDTML